MDVLIPQSLAKFAGIGLVMEAVRRTQMTNLKELLECVKAAKGLDRELDFLIQTHVVHPLIGDEGYTLQDVMDDFAVLGPEGMTIDAPYTASVDAALALAERVLPGWRYDLHSPRMGQTWEAVLMDGDSASRKIRTGTAASAALAIIAGTLTATLTALISQEPDHDYQ